MSDIGNKEIFAKNLIYYINMHGKEQKEVAEAIGVPASTFNAWVKAKKYPRIDKIEELANYFGILKSDLIERVGCLTIFSQSENDDERLLLDLFRRIPEDKQKLVLQMIQVALSTKE